MKRLSLKQHKMNQSFKKVIGLGLLVFFVMFCFFSFFSSGVTLVISTFNKMFYGDNEEVELDHWELSTVFYDSTVDDGKTPLTEINWDASDGGYEEGETRIITVQINYKNTNVVTSYDPGDLIIKINNLGYKLRPNKYSVSRYVWLNEYNLEGTNIMAGANDLTHTNYDWSFLPQQAYNDNNSIETFKAPSYFLSTFMFKNDNRIEEKSNLEGTIQIQYILKSMKDLPSEHKDDNEKFEILDSCDRNFHKTIVATLNDNISSEKIEFNYHRLYEHPWNKMEYSFTQTPKKILSYDALVANAEDYIWVNYHYNHSGEEFIIASVYPNLKVMKYEIRDVFPDDCVVIDDEGNVLEKNNDGSYHFGNDEPGWSRGNDSIYVGFPKSVYNENNDNLIINNYAKLYGIYDGEDDYSYLNESDSSINLNDYVFSYFGDLYSVGKKISTSTKQLNAYSASSENDLKLYYQELTGNETGLGSGGKISNILYVFARYSTKPMDVRVGDDLLYITGNDGNIRRLVDKEYYYSYISFPGQIKNANGNSIPENKYNCELWLRYRDSQKYIKFEEFKNTNSQYSNVKNWSFKDSDKVVAYYFVIKDAKESIIQQWSNASQIVINNTENISKVGKVYNYAYLQVYIDGVLQNSSNISSYSDFPFSEDIAQFDLDTYGTYIQRDFDSLSYKEYILDSYKHVISVRKDMNSFIQDAINERFVGKTTISLRMAKSSNASFSVIKRYWNSLGEEFYCKGFEIYDLLPKGVFLTSSKENIISSIKPNDSFGNWLYIIGIDGTIYTKDTWIQLLHKNAKVTIVENYKGTGRTYLSVIIDLSSYPVIVYTDYSSGGEGAKFLDLSYDYSVSYDSYFFNGNSYPNRVYVTFHNNNIGDLYFGSYSSSKVKVVSDNGTYDIEEKDIDNDSNIAEKFSMASDSEFIVSTISTNQDVQTSVKDNSGDYLLKDINVDLNQNYEYKLRVRTGQNDITNLVIYDSLEKYSKDSNMEFISSSNGRKSWNGEFLGIDTSYAESKGYTVKVYYSENETPGSLKEDDNWVLYTDSVDKSKVKSLAFEYLDSSGNPAVLPANSLTYVLIKMKSPSDESLKTLSYNGCWTEWNAIDSITGNIVDFVTGINSNIVKVALPDSVEPVDIDLELTKKWMDFSDSLGKRPENVTFRLIANNDYSNTTNVTFGGTGDIWTHKVTVPKYDDDGNEITYSIKEDTIDLGDNYKYIPEVNGFIVSNTLYKNIVITKNWLDNNNSYLTRPSNITVKVYQNGNYYQDLNITGNYQTNTWTGSLSVPVFDNSGREYVYTVDEISVDHYQTNCANLVCNNLLIGEDTITIHKEWFDNNNSYSTRPSSIMVRLKQNGNDYQNVTLLNDTWSKVVTVPKYDSNGVQYTYTIEEDLLEEYGLVQYDQRNYKVINTLKKNMNITITKKWVDNSNLYQTRPDELKITLLQNGNSYTELSLSGDSDIWSSTIEVPKYDDNQVLYEYSIKELNDSIKDEYQDVEYSKDDLSVTNKLKKNITIPITKIWNDHNNDYQTRPQSIKINILQNGSFYKEIVMEGTSNKWVKEIEVPYYDKNSIRYEYSIEELSSIERYDNIIYDQTTYTITNELTDIPKVTLYFTVLNGYVEPGTNDIKYDEEGFKDILRKLHIDPDQEYAFTFQLKNVETEKLYEGKLSTKGILEFDDIPYGEYIALEGKDDFFEFVSMSSIGEVEGVTFTPNANGGLISIRPVGDNIIYGANIVNKIQIPINNPETNSSIFVVIMVIIMVVGVLIFYKKRKSVSL